MTNRKVQARNDMQLSQDVVCTPVCTEPTDPELSVDGRWLSLRGRPTFICLRLGSICQSAGLRWLDYYRAPPFY
jgi:hypothetical protein